MCSIPPSILPIDNEVVIESESATFNLTCIVDGYPEPVVYRMKTSNGDRVNKTELTNISWTSDAGESTRVASSPFNTSTELPKVDVLCKFIAIIFSNVRMEASCCSG